LPAMGNLEQIIEIRLEGNRFTEFPLSVLACTHLRLLDMSCNKLQSIPDEIIQLRGIKTLNVRENSLRSLPYLVGALPDLQELILDGNDIAELPDSVCGFKSLVTLSISRNRLQRFPQELKRVDSLMELFANDNKLEELAGIDLSKLRKWSFTGNQCLYFPAGAASYEAKEVFVTPEITPIPGETPWRGWKV